MLELAEFVLGSHGVLQIREPVLATTLPVCAPEGRNDGQSCGLPSPKRKRGKPNVWASRVFGGTSASDTTSARTMLRPHLMSIVQGLLQVTENVDTSPAVTNQAPAPVIVYAAEPLL